MIKKLDIIIIVVLLLLSFVPTIILGTLNNKDFNAIYAEVSVASKVIEKIYFKDLEKEESFTIETEYGKNIIHASKEGLYMEDADCPDGVCLRDGMITKVGQSLVCLPHKLIIEIKGEMVEDDDDIIISH